MKRFISILSVLMLTLLCGQANAQKAKTDNDYNLQRAWEALREEKDEAKALDLVNQQLKETPDNVQALLLRLRLNRNKGEYGKAMADVNHALKVNKPKKTEIRESTLLWWKAHVYDDMLEPEKACESYGRAYELARKDNKESLQSISFDYACSLSFLEKLDEADAVFNAMLKEDETDAAAMVGLASTLIKREKYREALDLLDKAERYAESYSEVYRFRMKALKALGEHNKAVDAAIAYFDKCDSPDRDSVMAVFEKKPNYAIASIKTKAKSSDKPIVWKNLLARFYEHTHDYASALKAYENLEKEFGKYDQIDYRRGVCLAGLGLYDRAADVVTVLIEKDPDWYIYSERGDYHRLAGRLEEAIADFTSAIEDRPDLSYAYYKRGWCHELRGEKDKAMADYELGIEMDQDYPYLYLMRGSLRMEQGDAEGARKDFETILQKDTTVTDGSCRQYALHYLGRDKEAEEWMDKLIALDPEDPGNYYDRACLYARMGRLDESVAALRTSFEKGYRSFAHISLDDDMDPVRDLPAFKELVGEYKAKHEAYLKEHEIAVPEKGEEIVTEIAVKRNPGGTFEIPCDINGLPLQMIFDTGASDVTISSVEANFMLKNGYLSDKDVKGKKYYRVANGELSAGTVITLREVKIGDAVLHNVDASVVKSQKAPLLLGQSAMERFGTITIDNENNKLIIKH